VLIDVYNMNALRDSSSCVSAPSYSTAAKGVVFQTPATRDKIGESDSRMLADCRHDRQVLDKMVFSAFMFVVTILSAIFTTILELPVVWRNLWFAICITFAVLTFVVVFYLDSELGRPTAEKSQR
jgi:hypothetical protein